MTSVAARRWRNFNLLALVAALIVAADSVVETSLRDPAFLTGWLLTVAVALLTLFNVRKKLPFFPLGRAAVWLQVHIYVGLLSILLFVLHVNYQFPDGPVNVTLGIVFVLVALSGIGGFLVSRGISRRLTRRGEEVIYERIPQFRRELREEADDLVRKSVEETESPTIADFYAGRLRHLFDGPRDFLQHLFEMNISRYALETEFFNVGRYLSDTEQEVLDDLARIMRRNDELNYHNALQSTLKGWLFLHVPLTYSMLVLIVVHVILVYTFTDGLS